MTPENPVLPPLLAATRDRFVAWRAARSGHTRIPAPLWKAAVRCAAKHGVYPTVRALGLDYKCLKSRLLSSAGAASPARPPAFVEIIPTGGSAPTSCVLEVERPGGAKLRIELRGSALPDLAELARRFAAEGA